MNSNKRPPIEDFVTFGSLGIELVVSVLIGAGIGYLLDRWLGTKPWLMVIGIILGAIAGLRDAYRLIVKSEWDKR